MGAFNFQFKSCTLTEPLQISAAEKLLVIEFPHFPRLRALNIVQLFRRANPGSPHHPNPTQPSRSRGVLRFGWLQQIWLVKPWRHYVRSQLIQPSRLQHLNGATVAHLLIPPNRIINESISGCTHLQLCVCAHAWVRASRAASLGST